MATITIQEAQAKLPDLIHNLKPGEELIITENNKPVAHRKMLTTKPRLASIFRFSIISPSYLSTYPVTEALL
jgi:antitoxin (DNA-binding transcriptional repressor) of toxin-antitoxin stability system